MESMKFSSWLLPQLNNFTVRPENKVLDAAKNMYIVTSLINVQSIV